MLEVVYEVVSIKQVIKKRKAKHLLQRITEPEIAARIAQKEIGNEDREVFLVMVLNTKNELVAIHRCHVGSLNASIAHPREIFKAAILNNGASIIVAHNHPSQNKTPSREDLEVTKRLAEAGRLLGIELLDHLIVTETDYYSFKAHSHF
ncbi:JAB domain-containing protein (plasmid) [Parageobacillus thermoglucosidasius]|uniref:JAB domain-containing protein n=1 Tax=Parageobacillus thermoglucosidasius TaxID=1426 RepID=A0AB38R6C2_PARTM|nr:JAB domain-containing protein [Parageobacillus thermoglucosidasius]